MKGRVATLSVCMLVSVSLILAGCASTPSTPANTPIPPTPTAEPTRVSAADGMVEVFVPAGDFIMGSTDAEAASVAQQCLDKGIAQSSCGDLGANEKPQHTVNLDAFWIDRTVVTNAQFALCESAGACQHDRFLITSSTRTNYYGNEEYANYPVINVDYNSADAYCTWAGRRLPTEAEWEKAARGTDGRTYPWGEEIDCSKANYDGKDGGDYCVGDTSEVGSYPSGASPYGALDMAGNVMEWVADWYSVDYYSSSPQHNPTGPGSTEVTAPIKVLRGGSWDLLDLGARSAFRSGTSFNYMSANIGFRCASSN